MIFRPLLVPAIRCLLSTPPPNKFLQTRPFSINSGTVCGELTTLADDRKTSESHRWLIETCELNELHQGLKHKSLGSVSKSISKLVEIRSGDLITVKDFAKVAELFTSKSDSEIARNKRLDLLRYSLSPCIPSLASTQKYSCLLRILGSYKETRKVKSILNEMLRKKMNPDVSTFNYTLDFLASQEYDYALRVFRKARESLFIPNVGTFITLIRRGKSQDVSIISSLYHEFLNAGLMPTLKFYNILVDTYAHLGDTTQAKKILNEMEGKNIEPNIITYSSLIKGFIKAGDALSVAQLYHEILARNIKPDTILLTTLLKFYGDRLDTDKILDVYQTMRQNKVTFDARAYTTLIYALTRTANDIRASRVVLEEMEKMKIKPNVVTYSVLINALARAGDLCEAHKLFDTMKERGIKPDKVAYDILIQGYVRMGHGYKGKQLYDEMLLNKIQPKVGTYIAIAPYFK